VERPFIEIEELRPSLNTNNLNLEVNKDAAEEEAAKNEEDDFNHDPNLVKENKKNCILPEIIKSLIERRKQVKTAIKSEKNKEK